MNLFPANLYIRENFINVGFNNWKKGREILESHEDSDQHKIAVLNLENLSKKSIIAHVNEQASKVQQDSQVALRKMLSSMRFLAQQGLAIRGHDSDDGNYIGLLKLRCEDVPELKQWLGKKKSLTSGEIQNEMLKLIAHAILRKILDEVKECQEFAIIIYETGDESGKEQLAFCVRIVPDDLIPKEYFLGLYEVQSTTADALVSVIKDIFQRCGLKFENLRAQCYDGASNMSGVYHGVAAQISSIEPTALYIHCFAHCLNLAVQDSVSSLPEIRNTMFNVHETATLVKGSPKRYEIFSCSP